MINKNWLLIGRLRLLVIIFAMLSATLFARDIIPNKPDDKDKQTVEIPVFKTQYRVMMPSYINNGPYFTHSFKFENGILVFVDNRTGRKYYVQGDVAVEELK